MHSLKDNSRKANDTIQSINESNLDKSLKDYILLNKKEIFALIKGIKGFIDLLNAACNLFMKYFPKGKIYLACEEVYHCPDGSLLIAYIVNEDGSFEENCYLEDEILDEFLQLKHICPKAWMKFNYIVEEDNECYELWKK